MSAGDVDELSCEELTAWLYEVMVDEHTSAVQSRHDVRSSIDEHLTDHGGRLRATLLERRTPDEVEQTTRVDHPSNEQGAQALMALAAGART